MNLKNWIIKLFGGITKDDFEILRKSYEDWVINHMVGKNGEVVPDCCFYSPYRGDDILVIRSDMRIMSGAVTGIKVAPWVKGFSAGSISTISNYEAIKLTTYSDTPPSTHA